MKKSVRTDKWSASTKTAKPPPTPGNHKPKKTKNCGSNSRCRANCALPRELARQALEKKTPAPAACAKKNGTGEKTPIPRFFVPIVNYFMISPRVL